MLFELLLLIETDEDRRFFEEIYKQYRQQMFKYAFLYLKINEDAEDVVQDVFTDIVKRGVDKLRRVEEEQHLWPYLAGAVRNRCISVYRNKHGIELTPLYEGMNISSQNEREQPEKATEYSEMLDEIRKIPVIYTDILYYSLICEMKPKEIAACTGLSSETVRQRITRGKALLRKALEAEDNAK